MDPGSLPPTCPPSALPQNHTDPRASVHNAYGTCPEPLFPATRASPTTLLSGLGALPCSAPDVKASDLDLSSILRPDSQQETSSSLGASADTWEMSAREAVCGLPSGSSFTGRGGSLPTGFENMDVSTLRNPFLCLPSGFSYQQSSSCAAPLNSSCQRGLETQRSGFLPARTQCSLRKAKGRV